ncbi:MAG: LysE family transporter [Spirochaetes bacterium]|jgi:threonine/homoserine/homoserine lactone efflux protein|nr:LysE family transporter [Spirochaetota bacterium]
MESLSAVFFTSLVVALSGAMMPGPLLTVTINETARRGASAGPILVAGHAVLELALLFALIFGLAPLFKIDLFFIIIAFSGGAIMIFMAMGMFRSLPTLTVHGSEVESPVKGSLLIKGILMSLANPYWTIWWATIGIGLIVLSQKLGSAGIALFFLGHIAGDLIWYAAISIAISRGKRLFTDKIYRGIIALCGIYLTGFAFFMVFSGFQKLI